MAEKKIRIPTTSNYYEKQTSSEFLFLLVCEVALKRPEKWDQFIKFCDLDLLEIKSDKKCDSKEAKLKIMRFWFQRNYLIPPVSSTPSSFKGQLTTSCCPNLIPFFSFTKLYDETEADYDERRGYWAIHYKIWDEITKVLETPVCNRFDSVTYLDLKKQENPIWIRCLFENAPKLNLSTITLASLKATENYIDQITDCIIPSSVSFPPELKTSKELLEVIVKHDQTSPLLVSNHHIVMDKFCEALVSSTQFITTKPYNEAEIALILQALSHMFERKLNHPTTNLSNIQQVVGLYFKSTKGPYGIALNRIISDYIVFCPSLDDPICKILMTFGGQLNETTTSKALRAKTPTFPLTVAESTVKTVSPDIPFLFLLDPSLPRDEAKRKSKQHFDSQENATKQRKL